MITQSINSSQTAFCGSLYIEDSTLYGSSSPDLREDYGIAIFVNESTGTGTFVNNPAYSNFTNPGSTSSFGTWEIDIPNTLKMEYQIVAYWCPLWISGSYNEGDIVFYNGDFYAKSSIGLGTEEPGTGTEWTLLTVSDYDIFNDASFMTTPIVLKSNVFEEVLGCPAYQVLFKDCDGNHRLVDNSENVNSKRFYVSRLDETVVIEATVMTAEYMDFSLAEDQVYVLTVEEETSPSVWEEVAKIPVYEYCHLKTCATALMQNLLSKEFDPCCENCDEAVKSSMQKQQFMLNQFLFLYGTVLAYIHEEKIEYLGLLEIDGSRDIYLQNIENLFYKIKKILERCDLCVGAWQTSSTYSTAASNYKPCNC